MSRIEDEFQGWDDSDQTCWPGTAVSAAGKTVAFSAYGQSASSAFSWYSWKSTPNKPHTCYPTESIEKCNISHESSPFSYDADSGNGWNLDGSSWQKEGWWWSDSDSVYRSHESGRRASYYSLQAKQDKQSIYMKPDAAHKQHCLSSVHIDMESGTSSSSSSLVPASQTKPTADSKYYIFMSSMRPSMSEQSMPLPPMSVDGGNEAEFVEYWRRNQHPRRLSGGWVERVAHPQVNLEPYWYNVSSGEIVWTQPSTQEEPHCHEDTAPLTGHGPVWEMSIKDLKTVLRDGLAADYGLETIELAKRAVAEYEKFEPRVLSWHDLQYITFWFFGGLAKKDQDGKNAKSFFNSDNSDSRDLFADDAFFYATAEIIMKRLNMMHPIALTYMMWTFTRANVVIRPFVESVASHFCEGLLPMLDRCSLGTMVWNFSKQGIRLDHYFEESARELSRPNRVRSLAPRNFQNSMIAYSRRRHWNERFIEAMARGIPELLDSHDPRFPKTVKTKLFSYTCKDGSEVLADAFRISSCTVIAKAFHEIRAGGPVVERCLASMLDYTLRGVERSPPMMREPGDACGLVRQLAFISEGGGLNLSRHLSGLDFRKICEGAPDKMIGQMVAALRRCGIQVDLKA